jgi:hypothetical protein
MESQRHSGTQRIRDRGRKEGQRQRQGQSHSRRQRRSRRKDADQHARPRARTHTRTQKRSHLHRRADRHDADHFVFAGRPLELDDILDLVEERYMFDPDDPYDERSESSDDDVPEVSESLARPDLELSFTTCS